MFTLDDLRNSRSAAVTITQTADVLADLDGKRPDLRTVRRAAEDGQLPAIRVGRRILIVRERLLAMLSAEAPALSGGLEPPLSGNGAA